MLVCSTLTGTSPFAASAPSHPRLQPFRVVQHALALPQFAASNRSSAASTALPVGEQDVEHHLGLAGGKAAGVAEAARASCARYVVHQLACCLGLHKRSLPADRAGGL